MGKKAATERGVAMRAVAVPVGPAARAASPAQIGASLDAPLPAPGSVATSRPSSRADRMTILGGVQLRGDISVNGSKNAALPMMAAALLTREPVVLDNVPDLESIHRQAALLRALGASVEYDRAARRLAIIASDLHTPSLPDALARQERVSFLLVGPLLARLHAAEAPHPGGCAIGERPVNVDVHGFEAMGAEITQHDGRYRARTIGLRGAKLYLDYPSHTGTENLLMAACLADGMTVIKHASCEPEVVALAEHLSRMGALIRGAGTPKIEVVGVPVLHGAKSRILPDRLEAGSFAIGAVLTCGDVVIRNVVAEHLDPIKHKLEQAGAEVFERDDALLVRRVRSLRAVEVQAIHYPGFPTDLQAPMAALLTQAQGASIIHERVFPDRFRYVDELRKMGANIETNGRDGTSAYATHAYIQGPTALGGAKVRSLDIRCGMALLLAGMVAEGETEISDFVQVERGHEDLAGRLRSLGAHLRPLAAGD